MKISGLSGPKRSLFNAGGVPVSTQSGSLYWSVWGRFQNVVTGKDAPNWEHIEQEKGARLRERSAGREVYDLSRQEGNFEVQIYYCRSLREALHWRMRGIPAQLEFEYREYARWESVPVIRAIAWARGRLGGRKVAILVTEWPGEFVSLFDCLWNPHSRWHVRWEEIGAVTGGIIARMHRAGLDHHDLQSRFISLCEDAESREISGYINNLAHIRMQPRSGYTLKGAYCRWRLRNMAMLAGQMRYRIPPAGFKSLVQSYLSTLQEHECWSAVEVDKYIWALKEPTAEYLRRFYRQGNKQSQQDSEYSRRIKLEGGWSGRVYLQSRYPLDFSEFSRRKFTVQAWKAALDSPVNLVAQGELLKQGSRTTVVGRQLRLGNRTLEVVVKHYSRRRGWRGWLEQFLLTRGYHNWQRAHGLLLRQIPTAWPLAMLERKSWGLMKESIYISERLSDGHNLDWIVRRAWGDMTAARQRKAAVALGRFLARMQREGVRNRDCKASNIMVQPSGEEEDVFRYYLIDLDGIRLSCRKNGDNYRHEALVRLGASLMRYLPGWQNQVACDNSVLQRTDFQRVFTAYLLELQMVTRTSRPERHKLARELLARISTKARKSASKELSDKEFRNILIVKPSSLGDIVRVLPVLAGLRRRYPASRISWLVQSEYSELLRDCRDISEVIEFDRHRFGRLGRSWPVTVEFIRFVKQLRARKFDLVLDLQGLFRSAFLGWCTGASVRVGFSDARELAHCFYTHHVSTPFRREHVVESYLRFGPVLGFEDSRASFPLEISVSAQNGARELLKAGGWAPGQQYVVLLAGGSDEVKCWPVESYAALARELHKRYHYNAVLLGAGEREKTAAEAIVSLVEAKTAKKSVINLVGKSGLQEMAAILQGAALVIGNDSGPLHVAAALGCKVVGLYGPTDPAVVGPYGQMDGVVQAGSGTPRNRKNRYSRKREHRMENISLEDVLRAVDSKLVNRTSSNNKKIDIPGDKQG